MDCYQSSMLLMQKFKAAIKEAAFVKLAHWKKNIVQIGNGQVYREAAQVLEVPRRGTPKTPYYY